MRGRGTATSQGQDCCGWQEDQGLEEMVGEGMSLRWLRMSATTGSQFVPWLVGCVGGQQSWKVASGMARAPMAMSELSVWKTSSDGGPGW